MKPKQQSAPDRLLNPQVTEEQTPKVGTKPAEITEVTDLSDTTVSAKVKLETPEEAMATYMKYRNDFLALSGQKLSARQATRVLRAYAGMPFKDPVLQDPIEGLMLNALIMSTDAKYKFMELVQKDNAEKLESLTAEEKLARFNEIRKEEKEVTDGEV